MHYYKFNIGDYSSHTNHLDIAEDLAYRRMLDWCYLHESPLPDNTDQIARLIRMRTHSESIAVVLREFFTLGEYGWYQPKVEKEISAYQAKSEKAKASASARWGKRDANALQSESERNANHKPLTINQEPINNLSSTSDDAEAIASCPHEEIVNLYHSKLPSLRKMKIWNDKRQKALRTRWRENPKHQSLEFWEGYFNYVSQSPFLMGNANNFQADLEWLVNASNFVKVVEGKYHE